MAIYEVDFSRGLAYKGKKGYVIRLNQKNGLYVRDRFKKVFLTDKNSKVMEV